MGLRESSAVTNKKANNSIIAWINYRLPIFSFLEHFTHYKTPRNLHYMWNLGSIAGLGLVIQIITGILLAMHYTPHVDHAFLSVEKIMRDVNYGWLIRYTHAVGSSMFFTATYLHILRGLYYGSYKAPRELLWHIGLIIFLTMMATAFMGYVLPWGQMSYWGATVITNLFSAIPIIGESIVSWLWGGFAVDNPTLNRFFALHYLLPFILVFLVLLHIWALHTHGSNNPTGKKLDDKDMIPFHPYYTVKDLFGFGVYLLIFAYFVFYQPNLMGHPDNYIPANPMVTPLHIVPEWYFLPFYAILRAIPSKLGGVIAMFGSIVVLFFLPWIDKSKIRTTSNRPIYRWMFWFFLLDCLILGYIGGMPAEEPYILISRLASAYYFFHFLIILPIVSYSEKNIEHLFE
ncbi:cytochrome b [Rickettsia endosymbiont of Cardiosporidium cionae]|uniref:cytochrome b n=1 Tax=Rickettsia endosymbiont of Cardiosporidium cionae TaxID=2777155 RepID=UPI001894B448|nr:cytochrome b N-terminal domain-containing protein [Rickettsia endosymbiont of Cardiosporidium cionae]